MFQLACLEQAMFEQKIRLWFDQIVPCFCYITEDEVLY